MALIEVKVPDIGDFKDVEVIELLVKAGDAVKVEQSLITVESDKASMEIPSPADGVVQLLKVSLGDKVSEGSPILVLAAAGGAAAPAPAPSAAAAPPPAPTPRSTDFATEMAERPVVAVDDTGVLDISRAFIMDDHIVTLIPLVFAVDRVQVRGFLGRVVGHGPGNIRLGRNALGENVFLGGIIVTTAAKHQQCPNRLFVSPGQ